MCYRAYIIVCVRISEYVRGPHTSAHTNAHTQTTHTSDNTQHTTHNTQHTTHNTQHTLSFSSLVFFTMPFDTDTAGKIRIFRLACQSSSLVATLSDRREGTRPGCTRSSAWTTSNRSASSKSLLSTTHLDFTFQVRACVCACVRVCVCVTPLVQNHRHAERQRAKHKS